MKLSIYNTEGKKTGDLETSKGWKDLPVAKQAVKDTVVYYRSRNRGGTACVKTRSEVNFTTKKPWKQKGTGRARVGTAGNPIWRKGGVAFGPKPRDFSIKLPKKIRRLALKSTLGEKVRNKEIVIIDMIALKEPKTKILLSWLKNLDAGRKPLLVAEKADRNVRLSVRNIQGTEFIRVMDLNTYTVLNHGKMIVTKGAWDFLEKSIFKLKREK